MDNKHGMNRKTVSLFALSAAVAATCLGCGKKGPETFSVAGRVTFEGKPVPEGRIVFYPERGRPAMANIEPDGVYRLTTFKPGDGAPAGRYRVTIDAKQVSAPTQAKSIQDEIRVGPAGPTTVKWLVPEKYSNPDTSPLKAEVKPERNTIDFDL